MNIVITGGAGYVGCRLVPELLQLGVNVRVIDKLVFGDVGLSAVRHRIGLDRLDIQSLGPEHLRGVDVLVHLAGLSNDPTAEFNPDENRRVNLNGTVRLAKIARDSGVRRFLFASTCSIYYAKTVSDRLQDETDEVDPQAPYPWSKRQAEIRLLEMAAPDFCPVVLRKGTIFGYSPRMRFDLVVNTFTRDAYARRCLRIHGDGQMWRPLLHIADATDAYIRVILADEDKVRGEIFNVLSCNEQVLTIAHEVRRALAERSGIPLKLGGGSTRRTRSYRVSGEKFQETLGLRLSRGVSLAVPDMWNALSEIDDPENPIYDNIAWLQRMRRQRRSGG